MNRLKKMTPNRMGKMYFRRNSILAILDVSLMGDGNGVLARVGTLSPVERPDVEIIKRGVVMLRIGGRRSDKTKPPSVQDTAEVELWRPQRGSNPR